ncbi:MAG: DNA repair exonuclease [Rhodopirellula sp.]|nr:DNA repair exonuclease [Rhodopirellula sp.]
MPNWPFRFVHAGDLHLEMPPGGIDHVPEHLRLLFVDAAYAAAERVFATALTEEADFLVLAGDVLDSQQTGPRGPLFLVEQFSRLDQRGIPVYWAGGKVDPPDAWPATIRLPDNVHIFPSGRIEEFVVRREATAIARIIGISRSENHGIRPSDFVPDPAGVFSIAVAHGSADADALRGRGIHYWALGGNHRRQTLFHSPHVAHCPGTPQGRSPRETGSHACTVVHVSDQRSVRLTAASTDGLRWHTEQVTVEDSTTRTQLERMLDQRAAALKDTIPGADVMVSWRILGSGALAAQLRHGNLAVELLETLRKRHGLGPPAVWSVALVAEPPAALDPEIYEQDSILGDFLREARRYQTNAGEEIDLEGYLPAPSPAGAMLPALAISDRSARQRVLREAAVLGIDLLSGEEPQP